MTATTRYNRSNLDEIINQFQTISLEEMDKVKLMNREDTKFAVPEKKIGQILAGITDHYAILSINNHKISRYSSLYFDTPDKEAYRLHHNGRMNRYKFRYRSYVESGITFFEVKHKSNKGRTIKNRIPKPKILTTLDPTDRDHISEFTPINPQSLEPSIWIYFRRITLVSKTDEERVTIDLDLSFKNVNTGEITEAPDLAVFEVKQPRFSRKSVVISKLHHFRVYPVRISKYCLGIISCYGEELRKNGFKKKLLKIAKIIKNDHYRNIVEH